ncbi:MAG TPA: putative metal-binding motif-containing protein, partial [Myxococcota bacterium]|nr:putative metal-binding motif-containing protein [Myxococcota bacterium]
MLLLLLAGCPMYDKERLEWVYTQLEDDDGDGFREIDGDCDDTNPDAHPGQYELCNGFDDDCNGDADGDALDIQVWYQDR